MYSQSDSKAHVFNHLIDRTWYQITKSHFSLKNINLVINGKGITSQYFEISEDVLIDIISRHCWSCFSVWCGAEWRVRFFFCLLCTQWDLVLSIIFYVRQCECPVFMHWHFRATSCNMICARSWIMMYLIKCADYLSLLIANLWDKINIIAKGK